VVNRGGAGAPFAATDATGDGATKEPFTVAAVTGRAAFDGFDTAAELGAGGTECESGTAIVDASAACLNSTDLWCPRVAMVQSVSPKEAVVAVLWNPFFTRNTLPEQAVLHQVRQNDLHKVLKGQEMKLRGKGEPQ
jgi:hypothetical protein